VEVTRCQASQLDKADQSLVNLARPRQESQDGVVFGLILDLEFFECPSRMERRSSNAVAARKEETEGDVPARNVSVLALKRVLQMTPRPA